ncbi:hypothetical protein [Nocardiopsis trehalosi]|jgi:hypothetical protein|uniref:hypothetical protein n=1 Tax=Nocardiopsis trehalosi TaxID=109329 RepID=UPI0008319FA6|nr:hypothetical protein [Nocardiopsis trehalosi]
MAPPPRVPAVDPAELRPSRRWYWIGGALIVAGMLCGMAGFAASLARSVALPPFSAEAAGGAEAVVEVGADQRNEGDSSWLVYTDTPGVRAEEACTAAGPDGPVAFHAAHEHNAGGWSLAGVPEFTGPGSYTVTCAGVGAFAVAYGDSTSGLVWSIVGVLAWAFVPPAVGLAAGGAAILTAWARRAAHKRRLIGERAGPPPFPHGRGAPPAG